MDDKMRIMESLEQKGFDIRQAIKICADDTDLYMEVLETALEEGNRKLPIIEGSVEKKDYERYYIEVHALKNAARAIGAIKLSDMSWEQEKAAKQGDYSRVDREYEPLIREYREILDILEELMDGMPHIE